MRAAEHRHRCRASSNVNFQSKKWVTANEKKIHKRPSYQHYFGFGAEPGVGAGALGLQHRIEA
jgi:hypothetical protein